MSNLVYTMATLPDLAELLASSELASPEPKNARERARIAADFAHEFCFSQRFGSFSGRKPQEVVVFANMGVTAELYQTVEKLVEMVLKTKGRVDGVSWCSNVYSVALVCTTVHDGDSLARWFAGKHRDLTGF